MIPLQSLTMLNDEFIADLAAHLGSRASAAAASGSREQEVHAALFQLALARAPSGIETRQCVDFLARQRLAFQQAGAPENQAACRALAQLCRTLLNTSEFLYSE